VGLTGKAVFAGAKRQDPTGVLAVVENYTVEVWSVVLDYTSSTLEIIWKKNEVAQLAAEDKANKHGIMTTVDKLVSAQDKETEGSLGVDLGKREVADTPAAEVVFVPSD